MVAIISVQRHTETYWCLERKRYHVDHAVLQSLGPVFGMICLQPVHHNILLFGPRVMTWRFRDSLARRTALYRPKSSFFFYLLTVYLQLFTYVQLCHTRTPVNRDHTTKDTQHLYQYSTTASPRPANHRQVAITCLPWLRLLQTSHVVEI